MAKTRPFSAQGQAFRDARGQRKQREIADLLNISGACYQNWESGANRPSMLQWPKIKEKLGIDASALYTGMEGPEEGTAPVLKPRAIMLLVEAAERNLNAIRMLCAPHVSNKKLESHGIKDPRQRKKERIT